MEATSVVSALGTALGTVSNDMMSAVTTVLPLAIPVVGAILVVTVGIRVFKKFTK